MEEEKREEQPLKQEVSISDVKPKLLAPKLSAQSLTV